MQQVRKPFLPAWYLPNGTKYAHENELEGASGSCERWSIWCGFLVIVGIIAEFAIAMIEPPYGLFLKLSAVPDAGVAIGIVGEVLFGILNNRLQTELRARSNAKLSEAIERAAKTDLARVELEKQLSARTLTQESFDILQKLKGKIPAVIVASDADSEPAWFANIIAIALQKAGIDVGIVTRGAHAHSTANFVCDRRAFSNPDGEPTNGEPLVSIFKEAGIPLDGISAVRPMDLPEDNPDVPMIVIGGRFIIPPNPPYLGPNNSAPPATMLERIRNP
jgi:hypothetical protein